METQRLILERSPFDDPSYRKVYMFLSFLLISLLLFDPEKFTQGLASGDIVQIGWLNGILTIYFLLVVGFLCFSKVRNWLKAEYLFGRNFLRKTTFIELASEYISFRFKPFDTVKQIRLAELDSLHIGANQIEFSMKSKEMISFPFSEIPYQHVQKLKDFLQEKEIISTSVLP